MSAACRARVPRGDPRLRSLPLRCAAAPVWKSDVATFDDNPPVWRVPDAGWASVVADGMPVGAARLDGAGVILWANDALAVLTGQAADALRGVRFRDAFDFIGLDHAALFSGRIGAPASQDVLALRRGAEPFVCRLTATADGAPVGFTVTLADLTELAQKDAALVDARKAAAEAARAKADFMSVVSHELKTPLNGILGALALLEGSAAGSEQLFAALRDGGMRMLRTVDNVIDFALMDNAPAVRAVTPTARLEQGLVSAHADALSMRGRVLSVRDDVMATASFNELELLTATGRLIDNAATASAPGGVVRVTIARGWSGEATQLVVTVEDDGPGFPEDGAERLFEEFQQSDASATRQFQGLGLGLALVKASIRRQGGRIAVGRGAGGGARVSLVIESAFDDGRRNSPPPPPTVGAPSRRAMAEGA